MDAKKLTPMRRFWRLLTPDYPEIRSVYLYALFNGLISLTLPLGIQAIVNLIQGGQVTTSWIILVCIVVLGLAVTGILQIFQLKITETLQRRIFTRAAFEFTYRLPKIDVRTWFTKDAPELMNRFFDVISVQKGLSKMLIDFTAAGLQVIFGLILLSFYHPFFILFSLILLLFIYLIFKLTAAKGLRASIQESTEKYKVAHWLEEMARSASSFSSITGSKLPLKKMDKKVEAYLDSRQSHFQVLVQQYSLLVVFKVIIAAGLLAIGGILVMEEIMNIGQFIAAEIIILLVMNSVEKLISTLETLYDVLTALEKVGQVTDLPIEEEKGLDLKSQCDECGMKVSGTDLEIYLGTPKPLITKFSLELKPDTVNIITGPSGSGKTTLLKALSGRYPLDSGTLTFQDFTIGNLSPSGLREVIGTVLPEDSLFEGTLLENLTMGRENIEFGDIVKWTEVMGLDDFVKQLPEGYDTEIFTYGKRWPRTVVLKWLLIRAMVSRPKLLLLDEVFAGWPIDESKKVFKAIGNPSNGWTTVLISNEDDLVPFADQVIPMDENPTFISQNNNPA